MTKYLIAITVFLGSVGVYACPNLSGTFSDPANEVKLVIQQDKNDCSKISIDEGIGGLITYTTDGNPQPVPGTTNKMKLNWVGNSLVISSVDMTTIQQKWSLTATGDLQDQEQTYDGKQWNTVSTAVIPRI